MINVHTYGLFVYLYMYLLFIVITCPADTISNGNVVDSSPYKYSDTITYRCNSGYTLEGSDHRCCGSDGQWIGDKPQCTSMYQRHLQVFKIKFLCNE